MQDRNAVHADVALRSVMLNDDHRLLGVDGSTLRHRGQGPEQGDKDRELTLICHDAGIIRTA